MLQHLHRFIPLIISHLPPLIIHRWLFINEFVYTGAGSSGVGDSGRAAAHRARRLPCCLIIIICTTGLRRTDTSSSPAHLHRLRHRLASGVGVIASFRRIGSSAGTSPGYHRHRTPRRRRHLFGRLATVARRRSTPARCWAAGPAAGHLLPGRRPFAPGCFVGRSPALGQRARLPGTARASSLPGPASIIPGRLAPAVRQQPGQRPGAAGHLRAGQPQIYADFALHPLHHCWLYALPFRYRSTAVLRGLACRFQHSA